MPGDDAPPDPEEAAPLAPDETFSALGNETWIDILQALADAEDPAASRISGVRSAPATAASSTTTSTNWWATSSPH